MMPPVDHRCAARICTVILASENGIMSQVPIEDIESRLGAVRCAICKGNSFGIDRRTLQSDGECKGVCLKCRYSFPVHTDMEFYTRTQPDIPYHLKTIPC